jgi:hypothetical protein
MRARFLVMLVAMVPCACMIGPSVRGFQPATGPAGIAVQIATRRTPRLAGELLEVRDTAILVLAEGAVQLAPFASIRIVRFRGRGSLDFGNGKTPPARDRDTMRQLARFPAGLAPELLQTLLQATGQTEPKLVL